MKKLMLVLGLALALSANAFAEHPGGWGVGIVGRWDNTFSGGGWGNTGLGGFALSFKAPAVPIYWGLSFNIDRNFFGQGVTGDYHIIHGSLAGFEGSGLGWYFGIGGFLGFNTYNPPGPSSWTNLRLGARLPVGLSFKTPVEPVTLEIFGALVSNAGLGLWFWEGRWEGRSRAGIIGGIGGELGIRIWF